MNMVDLYPAPACLTTQIASARPHAPVMRSHLPTKLSLQQTPLQRSLAPNDFDVDFRGMPHLPVHPRLKVAMHPCLWCLYGQTIVCGGVNLSSIYHPEMDKASQQNRKDRQRLMMAASFRAQRSRARRFSASRPRPRAPAQIMGWGGSSAQVRAECLNRDRLALLSNEASLRYGRSCLVAWELLG